MESTGEFKGCLEPKLGHVRSSAVKPLAQFVPWERLSNEVAAEIAHVSTSGILSSEAFIVMVFYVLILCHLKSIALKSGSRCLHSFLQRP